MRLLQKQLRNKSMAFAFLIFATTSLTVSVPPCIADSEAASEAGSESGFGGVRRARRIHRQQVAKERRHEQAVRREDQREDARTRRLNGQKTVKNYGNNGRRLKNPYSQ